MHSPTHLTYLMSASALALIGAVTDVRSRRIPNVITLPGFFAGLLLHFWFNSWSGLGLAALAALIAFAIFFIFFVAGGMGGGDVKLMTAVAALGGDQFTISILIMTALAGGVMAFVLALVRGRLLQTLRNVGLLLLHHRHQGLQPHPELNVSNERTLRLPYGTAIAAGCLLTLAAQFHGV